VDVPQRAALPLRYRGIYVRLAGNVLEARRSIARNGRIFQHGSIRVLEIGMMERTNPDKAVFSHHLLGEYEKEAESDDEMRQLWNDLQDIVKKQSIGKGVPQDMKSRNDLEKRVARRYKELLDSKKI